MRTHRLATLPEPGLQGRGGRRYVARRGAEGVRVFVHHDYGRVARLVPREAASSAEARDAFAGPAEAADAIARDVLHRPADAEVQGDLARLLEGPAPRVEIEERTVRSLAGRASRPA